MHCQKIPQDIEKKDVEVNPESIKAIINDMQLGDFLELNENPNWLVCKSAHPVSRKFSNEQWIKEQHDDECISQLIEILKGKKVEKENMFDNVRSMLRNKGRFVFRNNLLYQKNKNQHKEEEYLQFVLAKKL